MKKVLSFTLILFSLLLFNCNEDESLPIENTTENTGNVKVTYLSLNESLHKDNLTRSLENLNLFSENNQNQLLQSKSSRGIYPELSNQSFNKSNYPI